MHIQFVLDQTKLLRVRGVPSLHEGSLKITLTVPFNAFIYRL